MHLSEVDFNKLVLCTHTARFLRDIYKERGVNIKLITSRMKHQIVSHMQHLFSMNSHPAFTSTRIIRGTNSYVYGV